MSDIPNVSVGDKVYLIPWKNTKYEIQSMFFVHGKGWRVRLTCDPGRDFDATLFARHVEKKARTEFVLNDE